MKKISKIEPKLPVVLDVNVSTCFDCQDDLVYVLLFALNLHNHGSVPFILHPACAGEHLGSMASPVSCCAPLVMENLKFLYHSLMAFVIATSIFSLVLRHTAL